MNAHFAHHIRLFVSLFVDSKIQNHFLNIYICESNTCALCMGHKMNGLRLALSFLTAVPMRAEADAPLPGALGRAAMWFPLVGFGLGLILAGAHLAFSLLFPPLLAAALTVVAWAGLTGGLHLDGLADCCDGLLASATPERRLDIMRDPRLGAFGVVGLTLFLILKILAVASLPALGVFHDSYWMVGGLPNTYFPVGFFALATSMSRWLIVLAASQPLARPGGLGADFKQGLTPHVMALAALVPLVWVTLGLILGGWQMLAAIALAHLAALAVVAMARARLGGVTGDVFGLTVELSELVILLAFAAGFLA
jgi:adenosylcobinamide-GDP ribazoletransferase